MFPISLPSRVLALAAMAAVTALVLMSIGRSASAVPMTMQRAAVEAPVPACTLSNGAAPVKNKHCRISSTPARVEIPPPAPLPAITPPPAPAPAPDPSVQDPIAPTAPEPAPVTQEPSPTPPPTTCTRVCVA